MKRKKVNSYKKIMKSIISAISFVWFISSVQGVQAKKEEGLMDKLPIQINAMLRIRPEVKQNTGFNAGSANKYNFVGQKLWITLSKELTDKTKFLVTIQDARIWGGSTDSFSGLDTNANPGGTPFGAKFQENATDIREAYLDLANFFGTPVNLQVGRQKLKYGDERLIGSLDWSNVGRSFDGIRFKWETNENSLHVFSMINSEGNALDVNQISAAKNVDDKLFSAIYNGYKGINSVLIETYYITRLNLDTSTGEKRHTLGTRITNRTEKKKTPKGTVFDYTFEGSYQFGSISNQTISAYAAALKLGYTLNGAKKMRFGVEGNIGSGDSNSTDGTQGTFINMYGTNHGIYGIADQISWQNMIGASLDYTIWLIKGLSLNAAYWYFQLLTENDAWYNVSGAGKNAKANSFTKKNLFHEFDFVAKYHARDYLSFEVGYSLALRGSALNEVNKSSNYQFGYIASTLKI